MADLLQKMVNHVHGNRDFLKLYIFHKVKKAKIWQKNPKEVHHLKEKKTMKETFDEMCEVYGNDAMNKQEFEYWYIKFYSGDFDMDHDWSPTESYRPSSLQLFIFSDIVMDVPIWTSYQNYCEIEGNETTDYPDYEFWFMRFARGEFDMDYDKNADPTPRSFVDLPIHVFEKISENFNITDKLIIRKVSKPLQSFIDSWISKIKTIKISNDRDETSLYFDNERISYSNPSRDYDSYNDSSDFDDSYSDRSYYDRSYDDSLSDEPCTVHTTNLQFSMENEKHWRLGFKTLKTVFGNRMLRLNLLKITDFYKGHAEQFLEMLKSLNGEQIHVEKFEISDGSVNVLPIIQYLKPEVLKEVELASCFNGKIDRIREYEQIKKVKMLKFRGDFLEFMEPFESYLGFPRVTVEVDSIMSSERHAALAIEILVKSTVLEVFYLTMDEYSFNVNATMALLGSQSFLRVPNRENVIRHKVPNSEQFYEIEITEKMIRIEKMP